MFLGSAFIDSEGAVDREHQCLGSCEGPVVGEIKCHGELKVQGDREVMADGVFAI